MTYKILQQDLGSDYPYLFKETEMGQTGLDFIDGKRIDQMNFDDDLIRLQGKPVPDIFGSTNKCCVSKKLKNLLLKHVDNQHLNFIETSVLGTPMWGLNILDNVDCINREKSVVKTIGKKNVIVSVDEMVLNQSSIGGRQLFRASEYPVKIIISEELLDLLLDEGITGIDPNQDFVINTV